MQAMTADVLMTDGTEYKDVQIIVADQVRYSEMAQRGGWPGFQDDILRASAVLTWAALNRDGRYPGGFDQFKLDCAWIESNQTPVDPTR